MDISPGNFPAVAPPASESTIPRSDCCPLCRASETMPVYALETWSTYKIEQCRSCGFVFASPRPTPEELERFYTSTYFERNQPTNLGYADYRSMAEVNARHMWHTLKGILHGCAITPHKLLDVGCATGGFLAEAQADGLDCEGVELSEYAVRVARGEFNLTVHQGDVHFPALEGSDFDVITMWHVLEHLIDPVDTLKRARDLLSSGGAVFVELPNWASLGRRIRGRSWSQLKPPEHINFFTPRSLCDAARRAGFRVTRCTSEYPSIINEAAVHRPGRLYHQVRAAIAGLACRVGWGGYVRMLAQKQ